MSKKKGRVGEDLTLYATLSIQQNHATNWLVSMFYSKKKKHVLNASTPDTINTIFFFVFLYTNTKLKFRFKGKHIKFGNTDRIFT